MPTSVPQHNVNLPLEERWSSHIYANYEFLYPSIWKSMTSEKGAAFTMNGANVATLQCPMREIGYEAWDIQSQKREIKTPSGTYQVELWDLKDKNRNAANDFSLILISRNNFSQSCEVSISAGEEYDQRIAERIYSSVSIRVPEPQSDFSGPKESTEAKKYMDVPFGFSFFYSPNLIVSSDSEGLITLRDNASNNPVPLISIRKFSGTRAIDSNAKFGSAAIYYENGSWMRSITNERDGGLGSAVTVTSPRRTIGGLPYFDGNVHGHGWGRYSYVVALSPERFLIIEGQDDGDGNPTLSLAQSVHRISQDSNTPVAIASDSIKSIIADIAFDFGYPGYFEEAVMRWFDTSGELVVQGYGFTAKNTGKRFSDYAFFTSRGYAPDYRKADNATFSSSTGYVKDNIICSYSYNSAETRVYCGDKNTARKP